MKLDIHDYLIRGLFLFAGAVAAILLVLKGFGPAVPALAIGGMAGAFAVSRFGPSEK